MNEFTADLVSRLSVTARECAWRRPAIQLTSIVGLYLALAFYRIDGQSLWTDEAWSVSESLLAGPASWTELNRMCPLYFILLGIWSQFFGATELALRAFSALLGIASVCITYAIADKLINRRTAVIAALLLATSPYFVWFAQEVRYISLMMVTSLITAYFFYRAISGRSWKWWAAYSASSILALISFVTVIFLIGAHGLYVLYSPSYRPMLRTWLTYQTATVVVFVVFLIGFGLKSRPSLSTILSRSPAVTSQENARSREILPAADVAGIIPYTFYVFSVGFSLGPSLRELHISRSISSLDDHAVAIISVAVLFAVVFVLGLKNLRRNRDAALFLVPWLFVPILGAFLVATTTTFNVYNTRYVALSLPAYLLILATGICGLRRSKMQFLLLGAVLISNGTSLANYYFNGEYAREDARSAAQFLTSAVRPGDMILAIGNPVALEHYYKPGVPIIWIDNRTTKNISFVSKKLTELSNSYDQIWLVEIRPWEIDPKGNVKMALDKQARLDSHQSFAGVEIYSYLPTDRRSFLP
jgi:uncharacterized membrane protein